MAAPKRDPSPGRRGGRAAPVHGSGLFTRGQTQVLSVCTLNTLPPPRSWTPSGREPRSGICTTTTSRLLRGRGPGRPLHQPPGERPRRPGRAGPGARDPTREEFPYAIRVVPEVLSSNGSTSQGSICGSTLALMDAGVPIKAPVAGISCGLIQDDDGGFTTFIDIQGVEDFHGEMDFKVAGTKAGITAIQMDLKNDGLTHAIIKEALDITRDARYAILDEIMLPASPPPARGQQVPPKMITMKIDPDKIRRSSAPAARSSRRSPPSPAPRSTSRTTAPSISPPQRRGLRRRQEDDRDHRLCPRGGPAVLRQGGPHPPTSAPSWSWPPARTAWSTSPREEEGVGKEGGGGGRQREGGEGRGKGGEGGGSAGGAPGKPPPRSEKKKKWKGVGARGTRMRAAGRGGGSRRGSRQQLLGPEAAEQLHTLCPGAQTVLVGGLSLLRRPGPRQSLLYCRGEDYHLVLGRRLSRSAPGSGPAIPAIPLWPGRTTPRAGTGRSGAGRRGLPGPPRAADRPPYGSYVFLGTILTDLVLPLHRPVRRDPLPAPLPGLSAACPTGALTEQG